MKYVGEVGEQAGGVRTDFTAPLAYTAAVMRFSQALRVSAGAW